MKSCYSSDLTLTACRLVEVRERFHIHMEYELHVPPPRQHLYDTFSSDFGMLIDALEAGLRFPLHPVIEACLVRWQISPSHMVPNSWCYLVAVPLGMLWVKHCPDSRSFLGLFPPMPGASRVLPDRPKWVSGRWGAYRQQRLEDPALKRSNARAYLQPRKKSKVAVSKQSTSSFSGPANSHLDKGKDPTYQGREPAEVEDPERGPEGCHRVQGLSQGFKSGLKKMGRMSYEFGHRVALEHFRAKYPDSLSRGDPLRPSPLQGAAARRDSSPTASRGDCVDRRGGRPLAGRLTAAKGSRRLRRGSDDGDAVRVKES
ncbi:hypothetical protein BHM03_00022525 [Ensete ventricosum]|uniref:Uncharacterized protein n=1 Tax=Ensete ventricosum TaxID=4639 RepID=A0A445MG87_ENSVE|nr:hypothetical protein BHM03_00022525 [Ensete ventricosum]